MKAVPRIIPISELRQEVASIVKDLTSSPDPVVVTQRGRAAVVMLSAESYQKSQHELEILKILARGETEIAAGETVPMDQVLAEADKILSGL
jgi:prevent-host-death family protein